MPTIEETIGRQGGMRAALAQGADALGKRQEISFQLYTRMALSYDGTIFLVASAQSMTVLGMVFFSTDLKQEEDQTAAENDVIMIAEEEVSQFNSVKPGQTWIGQWQAAPSSQPMLIAFSRRGDFFAPTGLWKYSGIAVYPALSTQIINSASDLPSGPIVSNSLPIWLSQSSVAPVYPSFLVPQNLSPPYVAAHIDPERTEPLQAMPLFTGWPSPVPQTSALYELTFNQLFKDHVRLTLYGFTNQSAAQYLSSLIDYSVNTDAFGFMSSPAIRDLKRTQPEIRVIAQKKCIEFDASYYQRAADAIARRIILEALVTTTESSQP